MTPASRSFGSRRVPWHLFRHDAATSSRLPAYGFVALFAISICLAYLCQRTFGAIAIWPANGVLVAALLLLSRSKAVSVLLICFAINIAFDLFVRGRSPSDTIVFATLNVFESFAIAFLARRVSGAGLRLDHPVRLLRFALLAATPSVVISAVVGLWLIDTPVDQFGLYLASWVSVELLGCLVITPAMIILASGTERPDITDRQRTAAYGLIAAACLLMTLICMRWLPLPIAATLPILLLVALRLTARQAAVAVLATTFAATITFLFEHANFEAFAWGVSALRQTNGTDITMRLPSFYAFLAAILATIYPAATVVSEKTRLQTRLEIRTGEARRDAAQLAITARLANQASEAKRRFLNMISHELRTPLGQVAGYAALLSSDRCLSEASRENVAQVSRANAHALELVDDMIDFARGELTISPVPFDATETVAAVLNHLRTNVLTHDLDVRFENHLPAGATYVGDARRLRQLLRLLLHNATKFTGEGEIGICAESTKSGLKLTVFDTGCGFDTSRLPELLQVFEQGDSSQTRCKEGAGIGLALAKRLLDALQGTWSFDSQVDRGTLITLDLPMEPVAQAPSAEVPDEGRSLRILVVDDHPANRHILAQYLGVFGCEVAQAANGVEAVEAARTETFDLILMDLRMPCLDGYEASRQIRAFDSSTAQVPILAVSAECREESLPLCRAVGIDDFLCKPVGQQALLDALIAWLNPEAVAAKRDEAKAA